MSLQNELHERSGSVCELCSSKEGLVLFEVPPASNATSESTILICNTCSDQIENLDHADPNHWRCLNDSMWSPVPAVQVVSWRMLNNLRSEGWPADLLDIMYLDDKTLAWAKSGVPDDTEESIKHMDSNGAVLEAGDTVVLIKDLDVKGANFTAKRGTAVRKISLVHDNPEHIEGRVEGQQIVILTKFVKKS